MSQKPISPLRKVWYKWKALRLPWRKRFLVGLDLEGNTFWEFRDTLSSHKHRMRRIVHYPHSTHYSEVNISPQWHQWLRHTRLDPPSLTEQSQDLIRQESLKVLAAQAEARWTAKPSFLNTPRQPRESQIPSIQTSSSGENVDISNGEYSMQKNRKDNTSWLNPDTISLQSKGGRLEHISSRAAMQKDEKNTLEEYKKDPWKTTLGGPSEDYQPSTWRGNSTPRGRK